MLEQNTEQDGLLLDTSHYQIQTVEIDGRAVRYRIFANLVYVRNPAAGACHRMNLYVPEGYYHSESINGFTAKTAPIFLPNSVGGYMPGEVEHPGPGRNNRAINSIFAALSYGCVAVSPVCVDAPPRTARDDTQEKLQLVLSI